MPELVPLGAAGERSCARFVFLGQIHGEKGIRELVAASHRLPDGVTVDVYGTLGFDVSEAELSGSGALTYRGAVKPEDVHGLLLGYDALVLPTYHPGEGYPGVILEAYGAGLPVVATRWRAVPELVSEETGVLVEPRDEDSLRAGMLSLVNDGGLYRRLLSGVREKRADFSDKRWHARFVHYCNELAGRA